MVAKAEGRRKATVVQDRLPFSYADIRYPIGPRLPYLEGCLAAARVPCGKHPPLHTKDEWGNTKEIIRAGHLPKLFADTGVDLPIYYGLPPCHPDVKAPCPGHVLWTDEKGDIHHEENINAFLRRQEVDGCKEIEEVRQAILKGFGEINVSGSFQDRLNHLLFLREQLVESFAYRCNLSVPALLAVEAGVSEVLLWQIGHHITISFPEIWDYVKTKDGPTVVCETRGWRAIVSSRRGPCVHASAERVVVEVRNRALRLIKAAPYSGVKERCQALLPQQIDGLPGQRIVDAYEGIVEAVGEIEHVLREPVILPGFNSSKPPRTTWAGVFLEN